MGATGRIDMYCRLKVEKKEREGKRSSLFPTSDLQRIAGPLWHRQKERRGA